MSKVRALSITLLIFLILGSITSLFIYEKFTNQKLGNLTKSINSIDPHFPGVNFGESSPWRRENVFINDNTYLRQGTGYSLNKVKASYSQENKQKIKILFFGDSFLWGDGVTDQSLGIGEHLEDLLNQEYGGNVFDVTVIAQSGASIYSHYDYFSTHNINYFNPDLVIYGFYVNDPLPNFSESIICAGRSPEGCRENDPVLNPSYQNCLHGSKDRISALIYEMKKIFPHSSQNLLTRYCSPLLEQLQNNTFDYDNSMNFPKKSIYYKTWLRTIKDFKALTEPYPLLVANFITSPAHLAADDILMTDLAMEGYSLIPMNNTKTLFKGVKSEKVTDEFNAQMYVNPGNFHSSSFLVHRYVLDIKNEILNTIPRERLALAIKNAKPYTNPNLVYQSLPVLGVSVQDISGTLAEYHFAKPIKPPYELKTGGGEVLSFQYANCLNLGYSNLQITLNASTGKLLLSGVPKSASKLGFYLYNENYKLIYREVSKTKYNNTPINIPKSFGKVTLVLGFPDSNPGCAINEEIATPNVDINIKHLP